MAGLRPGAPSGITKSMKTTLNTIGVVLILMGAIWFLQGINVLPGSFMTGQIQWAVYGGIAVVAGAVLMVVAKRRGAKT
jgi:type IV secretory pathway VirB6-like protein